MTIPPDAILIAFLGEQNTASETIYNCEKSIYFFRKQVNAGPGGG
jgi:hypothetical protein